MISVQRVSTLAFNIVLFGCLLTFAANSSFAAGPQPSFKKAMIIVLENTNYQEALNQPFLSQLLKQGAGFTNFLAESHPSQPNYIAMIAGDPLGVKSDSNVNLDGNHLGDLLEQKGKTWKVYAEDLPGNCFLGTRQGKYARKHVPFISFKNIQNNPARCSKIVNASEIESDQKNESLPDFSMYIPNLDNDGHDTGAAVADRWLSQNFGSRIADPKFMKDLLLVVTFDESESYVGANQVFTVLVSPSVIPGSTVSAKTTHYSVLKTIEDALRLGNLGRGDASAAAIEGIWQ